MFVPAIAVDGPALSTRRSARVLTVVFAVALLLPGAVSVVVLVPVAVLLRVEPFGALGLTSATNVKLADAPAASVAIVSLIALPLCVSVKAGPAPWACETKVVPIGSESARATFWALL